MELVDLLLQFLVGLGDVDEIVGGLLLLGEDFLLLMFLAFNLGFEVVDDLSDFCFVLLVPLLLPGKATR